METRTVHNPFHGKSVQISDRLVDRLRGKYASGPHLPNGNPEFGWKQFQSPPIQHEAAKRIEELEARVAELDAECARLRAVIYDEAHRAATLGSGSDGWLRGRFMSISNALNAAIGRAQSSHGDQYDASGNVTKSDPLANA